MPFQSDRALYLNADRTEVVEEGDPEAAFLLVGAGSEIDDADAARYGLGSHAKSAAKAEDKQVASPDEDKSLDSMTKDELLAVAGERGVDVKASATKAEIIDAIDAG